MSITLLLLELIKLHSVKHTLSSCSSVKFVRAGMNPVNNLDAKPDLFLNVISQCNFSNFLVYLYVKCLIMHICTY